MMMKTTLLACLLSACAAHGENYDLYISSAFSDDYATNIETAARDWERMVPVSFEVHRASCPGRNRTTTCVFPVGSDYFDGQHGPKGAVGYTSCAWGEDDACRILLDSDFGGDKRELAGHELGHAQGLPHEGPGTSIPTTGPVIMAPHIEDAAPQPTCLDAAAWYALRGWVVPACPEIVDRVDQLD